MTILKSINSWAIISILNKLEKERKKYQISEKEGIENLLAPVKEELCCSFDSCHISSRHKNTHLNHGLKDLH